MKTKCDSCDRSSREVGYLSTHNPGGKKSKVLHLCKDCRFDINVGIKLGFGGSARLPSCKNGSSPPVPAILPRWRRFTFLPTT